MTKTMKRRSIVIMYEEDRTNVIIIIIIIVKIMIILNDIYRVGQKTDYFLGSVIFLITIIKTK